MCLIRSDVVQVPWDGDQVIVYKVAIKYNNTYRSQFYNAEIPNTGIYKSDRTSADLETEKEIINKGIHVYISKEVAKSITLYAYPCQGVLGWVVLKCKATRQNHVASGYFGTYDSAVFTEVEILGEA